MHTKISCISTDDGRVLQIAEIGATQQGAVPEPKQIIFTDVAY